MNNRLIITCGSPGSASAWIPQILLKIFDQNNIPVSNEARLNEVLKDNINIKSGYKIGTIPNINPVHNEPTLISLQTILRCAAEDQSKATKLFKNIQISKEDLVNNTSIIYSHVSPGYFLGPKLDEDADVILFTYRDLMDQAASMLRLFGLSRAQLDMIKNGIIPDDITLTMHTNPKNFLVTTEDSMDGFYNKYFYLIQLREAGLGYLYCKQKGKCPIHAFDFESLTITKELESIEMIADIVGLDADAQKVLDDLNSLKKPGKSCYRNAKKKKMNIAAEYFSETMQKRLWEFFGDIMSIYDISNLENYSRFLFENDSINVLRVCPRYSQRDDSELKVLSFLRNVESVTDLRSVDEFINYKAQGSKAYAVFVFDKFTYAEVSSTIESGKMTNMEIYPLHRSMYGYNDYIYDLNKRKKINIMDTAQYADRLLMVFEDITPINLNYLLKYFDDKSVKLGVHGRVNQRTMEQIRSSRNIDYYEKASDIPFSEFDSVLINSQEARFAYTVARRLSRSGKIKNIYSFHPIFEYESPSLSRIIEKNTGA